MFVLGLNVPTVERAQQKAPKPYHKAPCGYLPMCNLRVRRERRVQNRLKGLCRFHALGTRWMRCHLLRVPLLCSIRTETETKKVFIRHATPFIVRLRVFDASKSQAPKTKEARNANAMYPKFSPIDAVSLTQQTICIICDAMHTQMPDANAPTQTVIGIYSLS